MADATEFDPTPPSWGAVLRAGRRNLGLLFLLTAVYFAPFWLNPRETLYTGEKDFFRMVYPWRYFAASELRRHHALPLWFPHSCCGMPFQADGQAQLFYPPFAILYLVPLDWIGPLYGCLIWVHVLLAGVSMYGYARRHGLEDRGALVAACGFMFAGKWLLHLLQCGHLTFLPLAWFPLLLDRAERMVGSGRTWDAVWVGVLAATIFTGAHPQLTLYLLFLAGLLSLGPVVFWRGRLLPSRRNWLGRSLALPKTVPIPGPGRADQSNWLGRLCCWMGSWIVAGLVAGGLGAVQLLPSLELHTLTLRGQGVPLQASSAFDLTFASAGEFFRRLLSLAGPQNFGGVSPESVGAFGVLWTGASVLAVVLCRRRAVWLHAGLLLLMVLFAFSLSTPIYPILCRLVPGFAHCRIPTRMLLAAGFPLGMLAGFLTQEIFGFRPPARRTMVLGGVFLAVLSAVYLVFSLGTRAPWFSYWIWLIVLGPIAAGLWFWEGWRGLAWAATAWTVLLVLDLWTLHGPYVRTRPLEEVFPANDLVQFLRDHPGQYRVLDRWQPGQSPWTSPLTPGLCCRYRLDWVRGFHPTELLRYREYLRWLDHRIDPPFLFEAPVIPPVCNQKLLDLTAVRFLVGPADQPLLPGEVEFWERRCTLIHNRVLTEGGLQDLPPLSVFERKNPLPRAFVVSQASLAPDPAALYQALQETDLRRTVLLESPQTFLEPLPQAEAGAQDGPPFQEAHLVSVKPNRIVVEVERSAPGYLVLLDAWYPGWKCRDAEGRKLPVWRANGFFRAVPVATGRQRLTFSFSPNLYLVGRAISLGTIALLTVLLAVSSWKRRGSVALAASGREVYNPATRPAAVAGGQWRR